MAAVAVAAVVVAVAVAVVAVVAVAAAERRSALVGSVSAVVGWDWVRLNCSTGWMNFRRGRRGDPQDAANDGQAKRQSAHLSRRRPTRVHQEPGDGGKGEAHGANNDQNDA